MTWTQALQSLDSRSDKGDPLLSHWREGSIYSTDELDKRRIHVFLEWSLRLWGCIMLLLTSCSFTSVTCYFWDVSFNMFSPLLTEVNCDCEMWTTNKGPGSPVLPDFISLINFRQRSLTPLYNYREFSSFFLLLFSSFQSVIFIFWFFCFLSMS